jgi:hypothetical protein
MSATKVRGISSAASMGLAIVLGLTACGGADPVPEPSPMTSQEEGAAMNEITPDQVTFAEDLVAQGVDEATAASTIEAAGYTYRVIMIDGESLPMTMDYRLDRINLTLQDGIVVDASWG